MGSANYGCEKSSLLLIKEVLDVSEVHLLKQVLDSSSQLSAWALAVLGGSVAAIVSASHHRPATLAARMPYFLFLPGWLFLGYSLYLGDQITGKYLASTMVRATDVAKIASQINDIYSDQRAYFLYSLASFAGWLIAYLFAWISMTTFREEKK